MTSVAKVSTIVNMKMEHVKSEFSRFGIPSFTDFTLVQIQIALGSPTEITQQALSPSFLYVCR